VIATANPIVTTALALTLCCSVY